MFSRCKDEKEVKGLFRRLAIKLHPDYGGDNELMSLLKDSYEIALEFVKKYEQSEKKHSSHKKFYEKVFEDIHIGDSRLSIIMEMYEYSKNHKLFKIDTTEEINEFLKENGFITSRQYNRLVYIYYAFKMDDKK